MQSAQKNIKGLILSGGLSTRMGKDKGELQYHDTSQRKYLFELLSKYCNATFISCNKEQSKYINDVPTIVDEYENIGPLGGILSAFQSNQNTAWVVIACDLPFINDEAIQYLIQHRNPLKKATCFLNEETNQPEPLLTIWEPSAFQNLLQSMHQNVFSPCRVLMNEDVEMLHASDSSILKNANTIDEYKQALYMLRQS